MNIGAGELDSRIRFERDDTVKTPGGSKAPWQTPYTIGECAARVQTIPRGSEERRAGDLTVSGNLYEVVVRYRTDVNEKMRIKLLEDDRYLMIRKAPRVHRRDNFVVIEAEEVN